MKILAIIAVFAFTAWAAYWQGHRAGLRDCPEFAKVQDAHNQELEAFFTEQFSTPTDREMICDEILDTAQDLFDAESTYD